jgi:hypothetical protein
MLPHTKILEGITKEVSSFGSDKCGEQNVHKNKPISLPSMLPQTKILEGITKEVSSFGSSRRQLTRVLDKPAFSRFSHIFQPQFVVPTLMDFVKRQVCPKRG